MSTAAEQRAAWAALVAGPEALRLDGTDVASVLAESPRAAVWLDGYDPAADPALERAALAGVRLVVAVPPAEGARVAHRLGGVAVPQWEGVIGDAPPEAAVCHLVCANVAPPATRVATLERAVERLRAANARLARQ